MSRASADLDRGARLGANEVHGIPAEGRQRVQIEAVDPELSAGAHPIQRIVGDTVTISADLIADGHDLLSGEVLVRRPTRTGARLPEARPAVPSAAATSPAETAPEFTLPLARLADGRYAASFVVDALGLWQYTVRGWVDAFASWQRGFRRKLEAGQNEEVDLLDGAALLDAASRRASGDDQRLLGAAAALLAVATEPATTRARRALGPDLAPAVARHPDRTQATHYPRWLAVRVDPLRARYGAWYELFPRSTGKNGEHGTFDTTHAILPYVAEMGFDVLYLPPIHPIGESFRKGKNNAIAAAPGDVGSPWAIGAAAGGHKQVHPALGTLDDFDRFARAARERGLELALDIALQVTPDHPYVKEHPEWFKRRADGRIQYAENPPKKYQDIYPFDFECEAWRSLWLELKSIFEFWIERGVRIFRVDNPHTKPLPFWRWCIAELKAQDPELIFLAEAFTQPKLMYQLAKLGFSQSYTYFTWRSTAEELRSYLTELTSPPVSEFFRPNFWPNTPDILPEHLQHAERPSFALRLVLAATLSASYGIYGPAFELGDNRPRPDAEEYLDNEKYQLRRWDLNAEHSLAPLIRRINAVRRSNPALQQNSLRFHGADNPLLFCFSKHALGTDNSVLVVINLDPHRPQSGWVELDLSATDAPSPPSTSSRALQLHDLLTDARYLSEGRRLFVRLDPAAAPAHIFRLRRFLRTEHDFDYFE